MKYLAYFFTRRLPDDEIYSTRIARAYKIQQVQQPLITTSVIHRIFISVGMCMGGGENIYKANAHVHTRQHSRYLLCKGRCGEQCLSNLFLVRRKLRLWWVGELVYCEWKMGFHFDNEFTLFTFSQPQFVDIL